MPKDLYKRIIHNGERYYGRHVMLDCSGCNENLLEIPVMRKFIKELVDRIDMRAFGEAHVHRFGSGQETGISAVQLIETSAITLHTNDAARDLYLDVFSCKEFEADTVVQVVNDYFSPTHATPQSILRK